MSTTDSSAFAQAGKDIKIYPLAKIICPERISLGDNVIIDDFVFLYPGEVCQIGSFVHIASHTSITGGGKFIMEDFSGLSGGIRVYTGNDDYSGNSLTNPTIPLEWRNVVRSHVIIKKHAIIGANTVILPGVTIGEGAAVGANSLVTKDCEPWTVYFGSPAKPLKKRKQETILRMEQELRAKLYTPEGKYIPTAERAVK